VVFQAFIHYAGVTAGELLGYLFTGLWTVWTVWTVWTALVALVMFGSPLPFGRWLGLLGMVSAAGEQVFGQAMEGESAQMGGVPDQLHTYTYMPDIGSGLVVLGEREEALGQAWHLPSPETVTTREEFVRMIFEEVKNKPARVQAAPKVLLRALDIFNPPLRKTIETLYEFEEPFVVDHSKFEPALGDHVTPLEEAIRDTVRWYRTRRPARRRSPGRLEMEGSEVDLCLRRF
jgi:nucleoside-diphosphate-sugar epimerase